ncbi:MAG: anthranilate phosphoribosyltransferase [Bacteroidota bacterium]|nr:anthranilate phosphoribosyltransferase [Bacteroidota bacterium]
MKEILKHLTQHKTLSRNKASEILTNIAGERYNNSQIAAFLSAYMMRPANVDELSGFRDALLDLCRRVDLSEFNTIDLCGTGGDGHNTFNISTLASMVVAGAGQKVAKHGNYGVSSVCGSSNVMEYMGYKFTNDADILRSQIDKAGICFLHAPLFHPAMKAVGPIRRELGMKTIFNILGPLINPAFPQNQLVGVYDLETARLCNYIYQQTDKNYSILFSLDGYDEVSLTGEFKLLGRETERIMQPEDLGLRRVQPEEIFGGDTIEEAVKIFVQVLKGEGTEAQNNVVLVNAALALQTCERNKSIEQCMEEAKSSLFGGKALKVLKMITE